VSRGWCEVADGGIAKTCPRPFRLYRGVVASAWGDTDAWRNLRHRPCPSFAGGGRTPENCELFLGLIRRTQFWDFVRPFKVEIVPKDWVEIHGGVPNCETVERISERLYRDDEQSLDRMLLAKVEVIAAAIDRHVEAAADGATRKRAAFLRRMRS